MVSPTVEVLVSPHDADVTVKSVDGAPVLASVKLALDSVAAVTPSMPPVPVAPLLPVKLASPTVIDPVITAVFPPSSVPVKLPGYVPSSAYICEPTIV